ncbi:uncharacterized protein YjlB [Nocardiopsis mwathae]|uniref:Uncharacterized protein YjlB n=1 Tax=Nocardiopsis mwathae TaxID=1472723 RepID=A0A7W9YKM5_9ACTN|nr:hypothetical protein [Nocardiopsis mwathae]MBB6173759.1 uncharacterized protein YjlB [Nocardiopsis mwathae]
MVLDEGRLSVSEAASRHLPEQGGIELQRDRPAKVHSWHSHAVHETLVVLEGSMVLEYVVADGDERTIRFGEVGAGARIELPARTIHQSTAGQDGCVYFIIPEGGKAAVTTKYSDPIRATSED